MSRRLRVHGGVLAGLALMLTTAMAAAPIAGATDGGAAFGGAETSATVVRYIVWAEAGRTDEVHDRIVQLGGTVETLMGDDGFFVLMTPEAAALLADHPAVFSVSSWDADAAAPPEIPDDEGATALLDFARNPGSLHNAARVVGALGMWKQGFTGFGIDVAVIDSGVAPVPGLQGKVVNGPDLSFDADGTDDGFDGYGHGTHLAGIIAGRDPYLPSGGNALVKASETRFAGIAPGARVLNVRAGAGDGSVDVSQVIAAIDWVVQHRNAPIPGTLDRLRVRVLNLAFGTDALQPYEVDPLAAAVENAWLHGIVVVASAGNDGPGAALNSPAFDPYVIAVGASDHSDTVKPQDDIVAEFSSGGTTTGRRPDIIAPGRSLMSLRVPGSFIDTMYPQGRLGTRLFKGSGTSQSAAVVSGAVALLLQARPGLTPDMVKKLLVHTGKPSRFEPGTKKIGPPLLNIDGALGKVRAMSLGRIPYTQTFPRSTGSGSLELARGGVHVTDGVQVLEGETTVTGESWDGRTWRVESWAGRTWRTDVWDGRTWRSDEWLGRTWRAWGWTGGEWQGSTWSGRTWRGSGWGTP